MRGYPTFAEALDNALEAARDDAPRPGDRFVYLPASAAPFVFVYSRSAIATRSPEEIDDQRDHGPFAPAGHEVPEMHTPARPDEPMPEPSSEPLFLRHALTPAQQRAVDEMAALGARLDSDFTLEELRRAFRRLARQYHPDRHPATDPAGQARLTEIFAALAEHYRCLLALFER